ncbi:MAG: hypothetical protein LBU87_05555 [Lactobacillales bacterium]|jgi:F0F1-type ATP synthase epsilon subunit|nr:hypothetical protein [Lactobacillales bacterium]
MEKNDLPESAPEEGKIRIKLISPLFPVTELEANSVLLPGAVADILILPDRAPLFISLRAGRMVAYLDGKEPVVFLISAGVAEVRRNICPVLAWGGRMDKIDPHFIAKHLEKAQEAMTHLRYSLEKSEMQSRIDFFKFVLDEMKYDPAEHAHRTDTKDRLDASMFT